MPGTRLRVDELGTPVAFRLRLFSNGAHHVFREFHGPDLDVAHLDSPGFGLGVQDALDVGTEFLSFRRAHAAPARRAASSARACLWREGRTELEGGGRKKSPTRAFLHSRSSWPSH